MKYGQLRWVRSVIRRIKTFKRIHFPYGVQAAIKLVGPAMVWTDDDGIGTEFELQQIPWV